jgi:A/G-specific adenine glycosylase
MEGLLLDGFLREAEVRFRQTGYQPEGGTIRESFDDVAPALRRQLLAWWERHGRHDIPWKRLPDGRRPERGEELDPYGVMVAEVMRAARQHSQTTQPPCSGPDHSLVYSWPSGDPED